MVIAATVVMTVVTMQLRSGAVVTGGNGGGAGHGDNDSGDSGSAAEIVATVIRW